MRNLIHLITLPAFGRHLLSFLFLSLSLHCRVYTFVSLDTLENVESDRGGLCFKNIY